MKNMVRVIKHLKERYKKIPDERRQAILLLFVTIFAIIASITYIFIMPALEKAKYERAIAAYQPHEIPMSEERKEEMEVIFRLFREHPHDETIDDPLYERYKHFYKRLYMYHSEECDGCERIED
jgi:ABC-type dipeptide/oligopeptide/nickel transport system permease component